MANKAKIIASFRVFIGWLGLKGWVNAYKFVWAKIKV